jgi:hypothetical protein
VNTAGWIGVLKGIERGDPGPWRCPERDDADLEIRPLKHRGEIVEWHLVCSMCGAEVYVRRGGDAADS